MPGYHRFALPEAYRAFAALTPRALAWEWLRRNREFRTLWDNAGAAAHAAIARADNSVRRSRRPIVDIPHHPMVRRWTHWGIHFRGPA